MIRYLLHVFFSKSNNTIGKSSNQKSLSSVNIHIITCNFTVCNFTQSLIHNKRFFGNFVTLFWVAYLNKFILIATFKFFKCLGKHP